MDRGRKAELFSNATTWSREMSKNLVNHFTRVSHAKSRVDTTAPSVKKIAPSSSISKRTQLQEERLDAIETENRRLLQRIAVIAVSESKDSVDRKKSKKQLKKDKKPLPLHSGTRKREQERIWKENQALLKRLQQSKPTIKRTDWKKDEKRTENFLKSADKRRALLKLENIPILSTLGNSSTKPKLSLKAKKSTSSIASNQNISSDNDTDIVPNTSRSNKLRITAMLKSNYETNDPAECIPDDFTSSFSRPMTQNGTRSRKSEPISLQTKINENNVGETKRKRGKSAIRKKRSKGGNERGTSCKVNSRATGSKEINDSAASIDERGTSSCNVNSTTTGTKTINGSSESVDVTTKIEAVPGSKPIDGSKMLQMTNEASISCSDIRKSNATIGNLSHNDVESHETGIGSNKQDSPSYKVQNCESASKTSSDQTQPTNNEIMHKNRLNDIELNTNDSGQAGADDLHQDKASGDNKEELSIPPSNTNLKDNATLQENDSEFEPDNNNANEIKHPLHVQSQNDHVQKASKPLEEKGNDSDYEDEDGFESDQESKNHPNVEVSKDQGIASKQNPSNDDGKKGLSAKTFDTDSHVSNNIGDKKTDDDGSEYEDEYDDEEDQEPESNENIEKDEYEDEYEDEFEEPKEKNPKVDVEDGGYSDDGFLTEEDGENSSFIIKDFSGKVVK